jgi:hypothetical protein
MEDLQKQRGNKRRSPGLRGTRIMIIQEEGDEEENEYILPLRMGAKT